MKIKLLLSRIFFIACAFFLANIFMGMIKQKHEKSFAEQFAEIRGNLPKDFASNPKLMPFLNQIQTSLESNFSASLKIFNEMEKDPLMTKMFSTDFGTISGKQIINIYFGDLIKKIETRAISKITKTPELSLPEEFAKILERLPDTGENIALLKKPLMVVQNLLSQLKPNFTESLTALQKIGTSNFLKNTQFSIPEFGEIKGEQLFSIYFDDFIKKLELQIQQPRVQLHVAGTPHGLENKGNTCFMNAAIQCLASLEKINKVLLTHATDDFYKPNTISAAYIQLLNAMQHERTAVINPLPFCLLGWQLIPGAAKGEQQDAGEFTQFLLQALAEADVKQSDKPGISKVKNEALIKLLAIDMTERSYDSSSKITAQSDSQHLMMPPISLSSSYKTLLDCLKSVFHIEPHPSQAGSLRLTALKSASNYFIVNLRRTGWSTIKNAPFKNEQAIPFPLENFDISSLTLVQAIKIPPYRCKGFVIHSGAAAAGHYTAYVRLKDTWFYCDDTSVTRIDTKVVQDFARRGVMESDYGGLWTPLLFFYEQQ